MAGRGRTDSYENGGAGISGLCVGALVFMIFLLSTDVGRVAWPDGHRWTRDTIDSALAWSTGAEPAASPIAPAFRPSAPKAAFGVGPSAPATSEATPPTLDIPPDSPAWAEAYPVGSQVCVTRETTGAGYCADVLAHDAPSLRVMVSVRTLNGAGAILGDCGSADGVAVGARLWIPRWCVR